MMFHPMKNKHMFGMTEFLFLSKKGETVRGKAAFSWGKERTIG